MLSAVEALTIAELRILTRFEAVPGSRALFVSLLVRGRPFDGTGFGSWIENLPSLSESPGRSGLHIQVSPYFIAKSKTADIPNLENASNGPFGVLLSIDMTSKDLDGSTHFVEHYLRRDRYVDRLGSLLGLL